MNVLSSIRPLLGNKAPRWTDETKTECGCDLCQHWFPLIEHIGAQLDESGKKMLNEFVMQWFVYSENLAIAESKLSGEWSGWEEMKNFKPKYK